MAISINFAYCFVSLLIYSVFGLIIDDVIRLYSRLYQLYVSKHINDLSYHGLLHWLLHSRSSQASCVPFADSNWLHKVEERWHQQRMSYSHRIVTFHGTR